MIFRGFASSKTIVMKVSNPLHDDQLDNSKKVFISIEEEAFQEHLTGTCVCVCLQILIILMQGL